MKKPWLSVVLPNSFQIEPTQADVIAGTCNCPTKCMYAMAIRRMFPKATYVSVNTNCITITLNGYYYHYSIPRKAIKSIILYDDKKTINLDKTRVILSLVEKKPTSYVSTPEVKEKHRLKSARRRADPEYVRPDSRQTLRGQLAQARTVERNP